MNIISSTTNSIIKEICSLHNKKGRDATGLFLIEGRKSVIAAIEDKLNIQYICIKKGISLNIPDTISAYQLEEAPLKKACSTASPSECLAVARIFKHSESHLLKTLPQNALVVILEEIRDPGNLGTIIRTACAANAGAIFISENSADIFNPKVVRSSTATLWKKPVIYYENITELSKKLKEANFNIYSTTMSAKNSCYDNLYNSRSAIMFGSEAHGLNQTSLNLADTSISIPISPDVESLNIASSVAIILFEAKRQKEA